MADYTMEHQSAIDFIVNEMREKIPSRLKYHSLDHTLAVMKSAQNLANRAGINGSSLKLLLTAAAYHDSGFLVDYHNHEEESCNIARKHLPRYNFTSDQIEQICGIIMATKIPQSPKNDLEKFLCDADLEYLGGDDYHTISRRLFDELRLNGFDLSEEKWLDIQINFLQDHHFWTDWAVENLDPNKQKVLDSLKN